MSPSGVHLVFWHFGAPVAIGRRSLESVAEAPILPRTPLLSAHRGGAGDHYRANSLEAIKFAAASGVDFVEFDVRVTTDNQFVVCHDATVLLDGRRLAICDITADTVRAADPSVTTLADVLAAIAGSCKGHVDLKDTRAECEIADLCEEALGADGFVLTSLEDCSVARLRRERPHLQVGLALGGQSTSRRSNGLSVTAAMTAQRARDLFPARRIRVSDPTFLAVNHRLARLGVLRLAERRGLPVLLWTVNRGKDIRRAQRDDRVWAFTTDYPQLAMQME
jgi:glycerophosphoryl diester phosphodiesterase